jgi:2-polyprenyl-3-methyl-5-hydroxy-6-metoxy-1,4-benzoquinol methylase
MISVITNHLIAYSSLDHTHPLGAIHDNSTNLLLLNEIDSVLKPKTVLDLGCSGGQWVIDWHNHGRVAIGLEGSDWPLRQQRANWPNYFGKNLFLADITYPFEIFQNDNKLFFDLVTAWEVLEHIEESSLDSLFGNIQGLLSDNGVFLGTVSHVGSPHMGVDLHRTIKDLQWWEKKFSQYFQVGDYKFVNSVRQDVLDAGQSTHFYLTKKGE